MAWGMALPGNFGEFFPDGDYVGWDEALAEYVNNHMPAEQKSLFQQTDSYSYNYYVAEKLVSEPGLKRPGMPPFGPIAAHEAPKCFKTVKKYASLGSLIKLTDRILAADGPLKDIIERFEPGVHHFFPIEIVMPKDVVYPKKYFVMAIGQYLASFSPEQSDPASWKNRIEGYYGFDEGKKSMAGLALSKQVFGNAHLWRERRMLSELICFSDQLMSEITHSGLRLPKHCKLKEI
jgi:hypothetical protein